ncbi:MAG: Na+/H+ antiporter NhaD/arsenite permease-like protein, partial [Reinekea sp.]
MSHTPESGPNKPDWAKTKRELKREANPTQPSKVKWLVLGGILIIGVVVIAVFMRQEPVENTTAEPVAVE